MKKKIFRQQKVIKQDALAASGTGSGKRTGLSLRFFDLFVIQGNSRDKRSFVSQLPSAVRAATCQSL